jgi:hypothetical protein
MRFNNGVPDGVGRQWNKNAELICSFEIINGTGTERSWNEAQGLRDEVSWVDGMTTGRWRVYSADGSVIGDTYWIRNRQVSRKRYIEACQTDPTLPRYDDIAAVRKRTSGNAPCDSENDAFCEQIVLSGDVKEARDWVSSGKCFLGEATDQRQSTELVESLYTAGAVIVWVIKVSVEPSGEQIAGKLIIELPQAQDKRKQVFSICDEIAENAGFEAESDCGQRYRLLMLD